MGVLLRWTAVLAGLVVISFHQCPSRCVRRHSIRRNNPAGYQDLAIFPEKTAKEPYLSIDAVVINPYRSANVGSLVGGEIEHFYFDEGDLVKKGEPVVIVDSRRYRLIALRAEERLRASEAALKLAEQEIKIKEDLLELDAATRQDVVKKAAEAEIARYAVAEAERELDLARFDLVHCKIEAPFTGYLAVRYKQPDEPVERLEKVFALVDSSKVYAVANVPRFWSRSSRRVLRRSLSTCRTKSSPVWSIR